MIRFESDYLEGALPEVMDALVRTNLEQTPGYGEDAHCAHAAELIREKCKAPDAAVHFLVGGTQANMTVIAAALRPHQAAVAAQRGRVCWTDGSFTGKTSSPAGCCAWRYPSSSKAWLWR